MKNLVTLLLALSCSVLLWSGQSKDPPFETVSAAGITLNYRVTGDTQNLDCQLISTTTGWVAVGFAPTQQMQGANFIIGYHSGGNTFIRDDFGTSTSTHASDTSLGGQNNIVESSSSETGGVTQLNFKIPLNSGDLYDKVLTVGQSYNIILGRGFNGSDSFTSGHAAIGSAAITIPQPVANQDEVILPPTASVNFRIHPNPFTDWVYLKMEDKSDQQIEFELYNLKGQLLSRMQTVGKTEVSWDQSGLPSGVYYLRASSSVGSVWKKVVKLD